jgi:DNA repair exonuclease SbcCD ATPase subunit
MSPLDWAAIVVAAIAAFGSVAAQRSAAKASKFNTMVSGRLEAEREAYERARAFDVETIDRQDAELMRLREENSRLRTELASVKRRLTKIEGLIPDVERLLHDRINESDDH